MKKTFKTIGIGKKVIPTAAALGILFSVAPIAENKASAGIGTVLDVTITSLGIVKDIYEGLGISPKDPGPGTHIDVYAENITYRAPNFTSGEFNISMHHTEGDSNFTKSVKVLYPNGKIEIHKLRSGQQLKITEAGAIIDLNPDAKSVSEHDLLYITQAQLDEGKTGVVMNQGQTAFVEKTSGKNPRLVIPFHKKRYPSSTSEWSFARGTDTLFAELSDEEKRISTLTSKPVSKDVLENYVKNDPKALADFNDRSTNILAESTKILETPISLPFSILNDGKPYQIIPYKKGTNKVLVKTGSKYLSGKEGNALQYSDSIGDDEVFELVQTGNSHDNKFQFHLKNKNGVSLAGNQNVHQFGTDWSFKSEIRFTGKNNNEIHNWLREWYPGIENEKQKYDEVEIKDDEKDLTKWTAKDSSGNVIKNSWVNRGSDYYYAGSDGVFLKGWHEIEGKKYYFHPDHFGAVLSTSGSNGNHEVDGKYYHFDDKGALQRSAWRDQNYSDESGAFIKEGFREIDGKTYYFQNYESTTKQLRLDDQHVILHFSDKGVLERATDLNGNALTSPKTVTLDGKQVTFENEGSTRKPGLTGKRAFPQPDGTKKDAIHYYSLEEGATYSGWKTIDGKKYHFKDGAHYTFDGHETIDGKRYYFNHDGEAKLTGFDKSNGKIYHYDDKGVMQTGWQEIDGKWYYFDESGAAKIGWFSVGGGYHFPYYGYFTYYAKQDGSIYTDTKVDIDGKTYKFDSHGHKGY
ncbi:cell wall-binding protein [Bacillus sp. DX1.1]|uniref:N-acetylmuramoyl-L-alanine amidase family protein n=1 Tax=unclassified Bacillus (in: firmicutes) TaxID=185979 RepID=UPI0025706E60|nr:MULTISPECIES: cell wall-binding protein [unclassified Bacillus (in: firmicutes)]MDM5153653.1 cell wall-binding protein [Bacillus sp. DX1.1]WJE82595.1 cell wall-binding protein [Bacillus sp. DX3.1]